MKLFLIECNHILTGTTQDASVIGVGKRRFSIEKIGENLALVPEVLSSHEGGRELTSPMEIPLSRTELVGIEYPLIVKNVDKAIKSLGGVATITKTYTDPQRRMELWFRHNDPYCNTACGDRKNVHNIIIKVKRRKKKKRPGKAETGEIQYDFKAEVMGIMSVMYKFSGMANFQFLPMKREETTDESPKYKSLLDDLILPGIVPTSWLQEPAELFLPPPIFSRLDQPIPYHFQQKSFHNDNEEVNGKSIIGHGRKRRFHHTHFATFEDAELPDAAYPSHLETVLKIYEPQYREAVKIFEEQRPIWSKNALTYFLSWSKEQFKRVLPCVAYYWLTGPWRSMWCKFGYDPRKDPSAKIYQTIDFRMRARANWDLKQIKPKRSTYFYNLPNTVARNSSTPSVAVIETSTFGSEWNKDSETSKETVSDNFYIFRPGILPVYRQMFYQALDIDMPEVQEIIHSNDGKEKNCLELSGWLVPNSPTKIRELMTKALESIMEIGDSDKYLRRARDSKGRMKPRQVSPKKRKKEETSSDSEEEEFDEDLLDDDDDEELKDGEEEKDEQNEMVAEILQFMQVARIDKVGPGELDSGENSQELPNAQLDDS